MHQPVRVLLTVDGVAARLGISKSMVYKLVRNGDLEPVKIGRATRFKSEDVDDYIDSLQS